jgi:hypothetical protein
MFRSAQGRDADRSIPSLFALLPLEGWANKLTYFVWSAYDADRRQIPPSQTAVGEVVSNRLKRWAAVGFMSWRSKSPI